MPCRNNKGRESGVICAPSDVACDASGAPLLQLPANWAGLPLDLFPIPADEQSGPAHVNSAMLLMALRGRSCRWYRFERRTISLATRPPA